MFASMQICNFHSCLSRLRIYKLLLYSVYAAHSIVLSFIVLFFMDCLWSQMKRKPKSLFIPSWLLWWWVTFFLLVLIKSFHTFLHVRRKLQKYSPHLFMSGSTYKFTYGLQRHVLDGVLHVTQWIDGGAIAAGQVVSRNRDKVVLAKLQVEHQDVLNLFLARVEIRRRCVIYKKLKLNIYRTT